jgi:hypothetical protein
VKVTSVRRAPEPWVLGMRWQAVLSGPGSDWERGTLVVRRRRYEIRAWSGNI